MTVTLAVPAVVILSSLMFVTVPVMLYSFVSPLTVTSNNSVPICIGSSWNLSTTRTSILTLPTVLLAIVTVVLVGNFSPM